jgi:metal-responsive CopG/Arc/MetJ family transcriptional regulator
MSPSRISVKRKKKRGRPATGQDPVIGLRLPKSDIARLDEVARTLGCTRSEVIRGLIECALPDQQRKRKQEIEWCATLYDLLTAYAQRRQRAAAERNLRD